MAIISPTITNIQTSVTYVEKRYDVSVYTLWPGSEDTGNPTVYEILESRESAKDNLEFYVGELDKTFKTFEEAMTAIRECAMSGYDPADFPEED